MYKNNKLIKTCYFVYKQLTGFHAEMYQYFRTSNWKIIYRYANKSCTIRIKFAKWW